MVPKKKQLKSFLFSITFAATYACTNGSGGRSTAPIGTSSVGGGTTAFAITGLSDGQSVGPSQSIQGTCPDGSSVIITGDMLYPNPLVIRCQSNGTFQATINVLPGWTDSSAPIRVDFKNADDTFASSISLTMAQAVAAFSCAGPQSGEFAGGTGSFAGPYLICTTQQFLNIKSHPGKFFALAADIDFAADKNADVAADDLSHPHLSLTNAFLNGRGHVIKNFTLAPPDEDRDGSMSYSGFGLFDYISNSVVANLGIENFDVSSFYYQTGGLAAQSWGSYFYNVHAKHGAIHHSGVWFVGPIVGNFCDSQIDRSWVDSDVTIEGTAGVGAGALTGGCGNGSAWGIVSNSFTKGQILNSHSAWTGGFFGGFGGGGSWPVVWKSFSAADMTTIDGLKGGISGILNGADLASGNSSFFDSAKSGDLTDYGWGSIGSAKTPAELMNPATFAGWNTTTMWHLSSGSTPMPRASAGIVPPFVVMDVFPHEDYANRVVGTCFQISIDVQNSSAQSLARATNQTFTLSKNHVKVFANNDDCTADTNEISSFTLGAGQGPVATMYAKGTPGLWGGAVLMVVPMADGYFVKPLTFGASF